MGHGDVVDHCHHWNEIPEGLLDALRRNIFPTLHRFDIELMNDIPFDNLKCPQLVELRLSQASARSLPSTSNAVLVTPCPKLLILWLNNNESILCQDQPERCRTGQPVILLRSDTTLPEFLRSSRIREIRVAGIWGIQAESVSAILQACAPTLQHLYLPWNCELARQGQNGIYFPGFNLPTLRTLKLISLLPIWSTCFQRMTSWLEGFKTSFLSLKVPLLKSSQGPRFEHLEFYHSSMNGSKYWKTHAHCLGRSGCHNCRTSGRRAFVDTPSLSFVCMGSLQCLAKRDRKGVSVVSRQRETLFP
ncbi:hypothetical protein DL96DRAFT_1274291 [Flagelloscypha sp. PMI_526]|nr:hypothetical protein DL96DRAFT_1274291 [Flagelloscypha sp. PMI_526]